MSNEADDPVRYFLFAGDDYYPTGGMKDYIGTFYSEREARDARPKSCDWAHVAVYDPDGILPFEIVAVWEPTNAYHISRWKRCGVGMRLAAPESFYVE